MRRPSQYVIRSLTRRGMAWFRAEITPQLDAETYRPGDGVGVGGALGEGVGAGVGVGAGLPATK